MADTLWHVADQAYPTDPALMPKDVRVVLGYIGAAGATPHLWNAYEVHRVHAAGKLWAPIHTVPPHWIGDQLGKSAAAAMLRELAGYDYPHNGPVFLDVEHRTWAEAPARVERQVRDWQAGMKAAGHSVAVPYLPEAAGFGWAANWTGVRPTSLPKSLDGTQYEQAVHGRGYDLSVFRSSVFAALVNPVVPKVSGLTQADKQWMVTNLESVRDFLHRRMVAYFYDNEPNNPHPAANVHVMTLLHKIDAQTSDPAAQGINVDQLAQSLAVHLGPTLGAQLVQALSRQLAKP